MMIKGKLNKGIKATKAFQEYQKTKTKMRIEHLINNTYQVTDGSTIWFQGSLSDCESYINQNKDS